MVGLAEPRKRKQIIGIDPQNTTWQRDSNKFGQKMLEKMGWSAGKGLGASEQGTADPISLRANVDSRGLGASQSSENNWTIHQDNFDDLLAQLNADRKPAKEEGVQQEGGRTSKEVASGGKDALGSEVKDSTATTTYSLEKHSKSSRARLHYHRFARSKDLSTASCSDLAAVFGHSIRGRSGKKASDDSKAQLTSCKEVPGSKDDDKSGLDGEPETAAGFVTKAACMNDYFKTKLAALKRASSEPLPDDDCRGVSRPVATIISSNDSSQSNGISKRRKSKKAKKERA